MFAAGAAAVVEAGAAGVVDDADAVAVVAGVVVAGDVDGAGAAPEDAAGAAEAGGGTEVGEAPPDAAGVVTGAGGGGVGLVPALPWLLEEGRDAGAEEPFDDVGVRAALGAVVAEEEEEEEAGNAGDVDVVERGGGADGEDGSTARVWDGVGDERVGRRLEALPVGAAFTQCERGKERGNMRVRWDIVWQWTKHQR